MKCDRDDKKKTRFVRYKEGAALYSMCQTTLDIYAEVTEGNKHEVFETLANNV